MPLGGDRPNDTRFQPKKKTRSVALERLNPFIHSISPHSSVPPVPKSIKQWQKKPVEEKLKYGFATAAANDRVVHDFVSDRGKALSLEKQIKARAAATLHAQNVAEATAIRTRNRARDTIARIEAIPHDKRPKGWVQELTAAKRAADLPQPKSDVIWKAIQDQLTSKESKDYFKHRPMETTQVAGITTSGITGDILGTVGKMLAGIPAGVQGLVTPGGPTRGGRDAAAMLSDQANLIKMLVASPQYGSEQKKQWEQYVQQSKEGFLSQYGPGTSFGESYNLSTQHPLSALATGVGTAAAIAYPASVFAGLGRGLGLRGALSASRVPEVPRTLRLRGGERAMGVPVEGTYSRSPFIRGVIQRPFDAASRKIDIDTPVIGRVSESSRAARITRRNLKRDVRREQATAATYLHSIGRDADAEELRAIYMRGKPDGMDEDTWLKARLDDVNEMLGGREMILPGKSDPKLTKLRNRVQRLQKKYDTKTAVVTERTIAGKLEPLRTQERSLRGKVRSAKERGLPTAELETQLAKVQDQLAVARGHDVGPVKDSPARAEMRAAMEAALPPEQVATAMQVADQFARGASPDNPDAWYQRITSRYAEDPESVGLDAAALLQEAGPRYSLSGRTGLSPEQVDRAFNNGYRVETPDGRAGIISGIDGDKQQATITTSYDADDVTVPYSEIVDPNASTEPPVFYSKAQLVATELQGGKHSPASLRAIYTKKGVKPVEMEWTGFDDWLDVLEESGIKSVTKEEVVQFFSSPLNAFDLNETLWEQWASPHRTHWDPESHSGVALHDVEGEYKELMIQLPGEKRYAGPKAAGHMPGIDNPLVQIRFHHQRDRVVIDELQGDWGAALRDVNYEPRSKESDARRDYLNVRATNLVADLVGRLQDKLGIPYEALNSSTDARSISYDLQTLGNKMDHDWRESHRDPETDEALPLRDRLQHDDPRTDLWNEWLATPERAAVSRMMRHAEHIQAKVRKLYDEAGTLTNAPHAQPYAKTYRMLGMKRMVAWAVHNGQDRIAWPQGIVPAVRYEHVRPDSELSPIGGERGSPEDHPSYPDEDAYERGYVMHESEFDEPEDLGPDQEVLFGEMPRNIGRGEPIMDWRGRMDPLGRHQTPRGVPMGATTPYRYTNADLEEWEIGSGSLSPGQHIYLPEGPLQGTFAKVTRIDSEGIDVAPSGIRSIEMRGDQYAGDESFEVEVTTARGREYGSGSSLESALREAGYEDLVDSEWFDDMESHVDSGWQTETDYDAYQEAISEFMSDWDDGHYDDGFSDGEGAFYDIDEVARMDYSGYKGLADLYDNVLPAEIKKEWGKKYGVEIHESSTLGKMTTEGEGVVTDRGNVPLWEMRIPPEMAEDVRHGQTFFQTATPISDSLGVEVKGAVELLGNRKFRLTLFNGADISTVIHELGHISLHDLDPNDLNTIERELAGGHDFKGGQWTRDDHERFARAWERFFSTGYASTTSLRRAFGKIMDWMRQVYDGVRALGEPITPEVKRVLEKRLGKVGIDEADRLNWNPELTRWGVLLSHAKGELEEYEARAQIAREKGTDEGIRAEIVNNVRKQDAAYKAGDQEMWDRLQGQIDAAQKTLRDRDMLQESRSTRRHKLLTLRAKELERALQKPDSRRYQGATQAADFLQGERETILRDVFGDIYDDVFADRRDQESQWLAARGMLSPDDVGAGHGFLPYRRPTTMGTRLSEAARPLTGRFGKPKTDKLNLHVRNQMLLWQQGDYTADIHVLHEGYIRALAFKAQYDMRNLFHQIGEGVGPEGPKEGWYLIDLDAKPLPREWKSANTPEAIADQLKPILDGLDADDSQLALSLTRYAENWIHQDPARAKQPDGGYGNVRQVHPRVVEAMMLPYTGPTKANPLVGVASMANTMARMSLIYANPGYIPSNIIANFVMLVAERGVFAFSDMVQGAHIVAKDSVLFNRILGGRTDEGKRFLVSAETGETHTTASQRGSVGGPRGQVERLEGATANQLSTWADEWMRAAAWSGIASKRGYRGHAAQMRLLDAKTEKTRRDKDWVSEKATNAMINFDRLTPWEQRWLRPVLFVWPFIRGSIAWPIDYAMEHPARAGAVVALTRGPGEQEREELGATPSYYPSLALVSKKGTVGQVANLGSVNPLGSLGQFMAVATAAFESATGKNPTGPFLNLAGYLAPQYDFFTQVIQGRDEFGGEATIKDIVKEQGADFVPFLPITLDILDETKPAVLMDQGVIDTIKRRTLRFTPQKTNLAILNQQAKGRQAGKTVSQKKDAEIKTARAAWNHIAPGEHMPRIIEQSIESYYSVQELRAQLKDELKKQKDYQPSKREPTLTPLQDAAIVYDIFAARFPEAVRQAPDPTEVLDQYGEDAVTKYRQNLEKALFRGKYAADKARAAAKRKAKAAA